MYAPICELVRWGVFDVIQPLRASAPKGLEDSAQVSTLGNLQINGSP